MTLQFGRNLAWRLKFIALVSQTALLAQLATAQPVADVEPKVVVPPPAAPLPFDLSIYGGGTFFSAKTALGLAANPLDVPNKSPAFGLRGTLLLLDGRLGVEAEVEDAMYKLRSGAGSGSVYGIRGHGLWYFMTEGPVRPFALLGVGEEFMVSKEKACQKDGSGAFAKDSSGGFLPAGCLFIATPSRNFAFEIGAGAKIPLTYRLALRLDARYMPMSGRPADPAHGTAAAGIVSNFTANLGLSWTFGGEPEDTDRDRIADDMDRCPNEAEDKDGYQDEDGCPDPDNDKDGVMDKADKCPNQGETRNGFQDDDGCPDEVPADLLAVVGKPLAGVAFTADNGVDEKKEVASLKAAAAVLIKHMAKVIVKVSSPSADKATAQARADAIKVWLVANGVKAETIEAQGESTMAPPPPPDPAAKPVKGKPKAAPVVPDVVTITLKV